MSLPPFSAHFRTNYAPTDEEVAQIREILKDPTSEIANIDDEIQKASARIEELRLAKENREREIQDYRALVSPFRRLPDDILRAIFLATLPTNRNPTMGNHESPMLLTQVSRRSREVAHATPRLWAAIHIAAPPIFDASPEHVSQNELSVHVTEMRLKAIEQWISRSGACLLNISLYELEGMMNGSSNTLRLLKGVLPYKDRWRSISISTSAKILESFREHLDVDFPELVGLKVVISGFPRESTFLNCGQLVHAPNLRMLALTGFVQDIMTVSGQDAMPQAKWDALTELTLESRAWGEGNNPTMSNTKAILRRCASLTRLALKFISFGPSEDPDATDLAKSELFLPNLRTLVLYEGSRGPFLLPFVNAPLLRQLEYVCSSRTQAVPGVTAPLLTFLQKGICSLRTLVTSASCSTSADFVESLRLCPELRALVLRRLQMSPIMSDVEAQQGFSDPFLDRFTYTPPDQASPLPNPIMSGFSDVLCPKLEEAHFTSDVRFSEEAFCNFITKKQAGTYPELGKLKVVDVHFFSKKRQSVEWLQVFKREIQDGLKLHVEYRMSNVKSIFSLSIGLHNN